MEDKLKEIIKQHLPQTVAGEMKEFVEQAEKDKKELERLKDLCEKRAKELDKLGIQIEGLKKGLNEFKAREEVIVKKEAELRSLTISLEERSRGMREERLCIERDEATKRADVVTNLVSTIFRNPTVKKTVIEHEPIERDSYDSYYCNNTNRTVYEKSGTYVENVQRTKETTEEIE